MRKRPICVADRLFDVLRVVPPLRDRSSAEPTDHRADEYGAELRPGASRVGYLAR